MRRSAPKRRTHGNLPRASRERLQARLARQGGQQRPGPAPVAPGGLWAFLVALAGSVSLDGVQVLDQEDEVLDQEDEVLDQEDEVRTRNGHPVIDAEWEPV